MIRLPCRWKGTGFLSFKNAKFTAFWGREEGKKKKKKKKKKVWLQQLLQCYCRMNAAQMKDDECRFYSRTSEKVLEHTHTCAGVHMDKKKTRIHNMQKTLAHIRLKLRRLMSPPPHPQCKKDDQSEETDGIVSYHGDCSWPQLMMVNNPNECYTMFAIAISLSAPGLAEKW